MKKTLKYFDLFVVLLDLVFLGLEFVLDPHDVGPHDLDLVVQESGASLDFVGAHSLDVAHHLILDVSVDLHF